MENKKAAKNKSKKFAIRIVNLYKYLCNEKKEFVLSKQILRSGTSIGANIAESECAASKKDFVAKIYIALKECNETAYWLELLRDTEYLNESEYNSLYSDCMEIHYPQLSEINSLRLAYGEPPPSKREAISGSLFEGAVSEAD